MFVAFVDDPGAEPDSSCTTEMGMRLGTPGGQSPESGPIELAPFESTELEIAGVVPVGWAQVDDGVWSRAALATDATVLVQRAIPADRSDEALAGLLGEFGASELGEAVETVDLDDRGWEVFVPDAAIGLVVATATLTDRTFVVALAAAPDELDELVETVFQPALASFRAERS